jgi:hypothetical protein
MLGNSIDADAGAALDHDTVGRMAGLVVAAGAAAHPAHLKRPDLVQLARTALDALDGWNNIPAINRMARTIAQVSRDRLSADVVRLLDAPHPSIWAVPRHGASTISAAASNAGWLWRGWSVLSA